ncbi:lef6 [Leucania separata nucleopolyhedrovirus]|uniref:Lef6 n=1 Tax=Leucania separata nucleopolyhedrovirus TaxID=1307956 RepID=Q0IL89_NPVLS|nr:lef6 [Leucania separata nucleopolyhedrovirus]AAR28794.1 lef6 [Leucania separata nucleopolyhedrovirus]
MSSSFDNNISNNHHHHHHSHHGNRATGSSSSSRRNFIVNIRNGQNYPKSLVKELIVYACNNNVARDIDWRLSSRRYLHVTTLKALESLENMDVYWPTGDRFSCRLVAENHRSDSSRHRVKRRAKDYTKQQLEELTNGYYSQQQQQQNGDDEPVRECRKKKHYHHHHHHHEHDRYDRRDSPRSSLGGGRHHEDYDSPAETEVFDTDAELDRVGADPMQVC